MENIANKIQERIYGEILLFCNRNDYNDHEKELIIKAVADNITYTAYYLDLIHEYIPTLLKVVKDESFNKSLINQINTIIAENINYQCQSSETKYENLDWIRYCTNINYGFPWNESYDHAVKNRLLNVEKIRSSYDRGVVSLEYPYNINFLITNNYLLRKYPSFYSPDDIEQLKETISLKDRKHFDNYGDYWDYCKIAKITLRNIKKIETKKVHSKELVKSKFKNEKN